MAVVLWLKPRAFDVGWSFPSIRFVMKLWQGWPGQNRFCCFGHFLAPGRFFPSLVTFPLILVFVGVFALIELPRISGFWWMIVVVCSGLLLLGAIVAFLQAMTTDPGLQVRLSVLPALTLSKDGRKTTSDLCKMYASCCWPPRFSDSQKGGREAEGPGGVSKGDTGTNGTDTMFGGRWGGRGTWHESGGRILGQGDGRWTLTQHEVVYYLPGSTVPSHFTLQHLRQLCLWLRSSLLLDRKLCWSSKPSILPFLCVGLGVPGLAVHIRLCGRCGGQHILFPWFPWPGFWCQR